MVKIVIGANASGKSYYIENNEEFNGYTKLNVYDFQQQVQEEARNKEAISSRETYKILYEANERLTRAVVEAVKAGQDVVVEHTLFKMKRRIGMVDAIRNACDTPIEIYLMRPSEERLKQNCKERDVDDDFSFGFIKKQIEEIELPSVKEGFTKTFIVKSDVNVRIIKENKESTCAHNLEMATEEYVFEVEESLLEEARVEIYEEQKRMNEEKEKEKEFLEAVELTKTKPFLHICCGCGRRELLTSEQAFEEGWDYPGMHGLYKEMPYYGFRSLAPRTCGNCPITSSVYWKVTQGKHLADEDNKVIERIKNEPMSLLE